MDEFESATPEDLARARAEVFQRYAPERQNLGALRFLSSVPFGPQLAAGAQALGARLRGDTDDLGVSYAYHRRRNDEALRELGQEETGAGWQAASALPYFAMGPAAQATYAGTAAATRGGSPIDIGLEVASAGLPSHGPSGPIDVGPAMAGATRSARHGRQPVVYHGTNAEFDRFDPEMSGSVTPNSYDTPVIWFTPDYGYAQRHADTLARMRGGTPRVVEANLRLKRPMVVDLMDEGARVARSIGADPPRTPAEAKELLAGSGDLLDPFIFEAKRGGHDGIILRNFADRTLGGGESVIDAHLAFDPSTIRTRNPSARSAAMRKARPEK